MRVARTVVAALLFASAAHAQDTAEVVDDGQFGAGRAVLLVLLILLLGGLVYMGWSIRKMRRANAGEEESEVEEIQGIGNAGQNRLNTWKIIHSELSFGRVLGQGSHGKVYKAEYRGVPVAAKEVVGSAMTDEEIATSMKILIQARHPNLVLLMGIARPPQKNGEKGKLFVVSEFMYRQSLYSVLHDPAIVLDWKTTIGLMKDVAKALMYMHQSRPPMLHRNLTSLNILVTEDLVAKIGDYGLDEVRRGSDEKQSSSLWNAPEVFKKSVHSKATNVFSFGIIMWELLTRRAPYQDGVAAVITPANMLKLVKNIMECDVRPRLPDNTPPGLASLINACWAASPDTRLAPDEILFALDKLSKLNIDITNIVEPTIVIDRPRSSRSEAAWMVDYKELKFENMIGSGAFGDVWTAQFRGQTVAVKKLHEAQMTEAFESELTIMCALRHPNTVLFMGACTEAEHMCMILEYCDKGSLFDILHDQSQHIDFSRILTVLMQACKGMMYLHLHDPPILHRDLKSLNILVDGDWNVKVADFGLTDFKHEGQVTNLEMGSPYWLAPEAMEYQRFSEASDVYSFGVIMWEMFTRQVPFGDMNPYQAAMAVITEDKRPLIPAYVPPNFTDLIETAWHRNPKKRPSFPKILKMLERLAEEGLPRTELTLRNAHFYRKRATVFAFKSKDPVIVYKSWGTGESKPGDFIVVGPKDDIYTCDAGVFKNTYGAHSSGRPRLYHKTGAILAKQVSSSSCP
jgi:serine/threonine protein kinase